MTLATVTLVNPRPKSCWYELAHSYPASVIKLLSPRDAPAGTQNTGGFHKDPADGIIITL